MNLKDRMKHYESTVGSKLILRCPAIIRLDGRAFHTFTKPFKHPYDDLFRSLMVDTAKHLCKSISTACFAYGQSDEISILLIDYKYFETEQYFGGKVQKITSVVASEATNAFNNALWKIVECSTDFDEIAKKLKNSLFKATFDARVFSIPERDVMNYFIWRQQDCIRNAILSLGQAYFPRKKLHGKSIVDICNMLEFKNKIMNLEQNITWDQQPEEFKYGFTVYNVNRDCAENRWHDFPACEFKKHHTFLDKLLEPIET